MHRRAGIHPRPARRALESRATVDRILNSHDYDTAVLSYASSDTDPNPAMNLLLSSAPMHLWNPGQARPATPWEAEIDDLMRRQLSVLQHEQRKKLVDRVQALIAEQLPLVPIVAPHVLVGARSDLANLRPGILPSYALWNADEIFWKPAPRAVR